MASKARVGFVGATGLMGHGMAKNLLIKGWPVTMYVRPNRPTDRIQDLFAKGGKQASTPAEMTRNSDVVLMCVTGSPEVDSCVYGEHGILAAARPGLVVIDSSTSEVSASTRTREALGAKGVKFVDAPLTRTPAAAEEGKANTMVGADAATFEALRPLFAAYCEHIIHAGPPGHGLVLKLINNFVGQAITTATAEGLATAAKTGLDIRKLYELMSLGSVNNLMFQFMVKNMLEGGPEQLEGLKFSLANAEKDVSGGGTGVMSAKFFACRRWR
jgi:3-hydroxyisobutyrate dehydrogenase-like beta-hydroxyacid dehydrogenase